MKKIIFCFDLDNVICITKKNDYNSSNPNKKAIKLINNLYIKGHYIKIFTARYMGRNNQNQKKARSQGFNLTHKQLAKWKVFYHELIMGKPSYDIFVDDKAFGFQKKWVNSLEKKYLKS